MGFIISSVGSAVGLGNIWSFPYKLADGGTLFLWSYIFLALFVGIPLLTGEMCIGRMSGNGVISAYGNLSPKLSFLGILSVISPCIVMSYYTVIGGLCIRYFFANLKGIVFGFSYSDSKLFFNETSSEILCVIAYSLLFVLITYLISRKGISSGIEKFNKIAMPMLFGILILLAFVTLKKYGIGEISMHQFDFAEISFAEALKAFSSAGEQMFFSLSIAVGIMVTYGSLMNKKQNIPISAAAVAAADSVVAFFAGLTVIPVAFSINANGGETSGIGLLFVTMQNVFVSGSNFGAAFGSLFFLLVIIAAVSSAVAFVEVPVSAIYDVGVKNRNTALIFCCIIISIPAILIGADGFKNHVMELCIFIAEGIVIPVTALISSVYIGWFGGLEEICSELRGSKYYTTCKKLFPLVFKFFAPIVIVLVIIGQIIAYAANT